MPERIHNVIDSSVAPVTNVTDGNPEATMSADTPKEFEWLRLGAPGEFWRRLDRWREQQKGTIKPSRPASIRWIVYQFLLKEGQAARRAKPNRKRRKK
jgi:hypothetical protein